jgi:hypothetical protein
MENTFGGLNCNVDEIICSIEGLEKYKRGSLPPRSQIYIASYELQAIR